MTLQEDLNDSLSTAVCANSLFSVEKYLKKGADPNIYYDKSPLLSYAAYHCKFEIIKALIEYGADPTCYKSTNRFPFLIFISLKKHELLKDGMILFKSDSYDDVYRTINYIESYEFQKERIDKFPDLFSMLYKLDFLNERIKTEYNHLYSALELNLL